MNIKDINEVIQFKQQQVGTYNKQEIKGYIKFIINRWINIVSRQHNNNIRQIKQKYNTQIVNKQKQHQVKLSHVQQKIILIKNKNQQLQSQISSYLSQLSSYKSSSQSLHSQLSSISSSHQQQINKLYQQLQSSQSKLTKLQKQLQQVYTKLDNKNDELSKLTKQKLKLQHQINQLKLNNMKKQFNQLNQSDRNGKSYEKRDQYQIQNKQIKNILQDKNNIIKSINNKNLQINQQIQRLNSVISQNHININSNNTNMNNNSNSNSNGNKRKLSESNNTNTDNNPKPTSTKLQVLSQIQQSAQQSSSLFYSSPPSIDKQKQYLKNVFISYLHQFMNNQTQSADTLLNVILTILQVSDKQTKQINQMIKQKEIINGGPWGLCEK